jgi:hypothetical protein
VKKPREGTNENGRKDAKPELGGFKRPVKKRPGIFNHFSNNMNFP